MRMPLKCLGVAVVIALLPGALPAGAAAANPERAATATPGHAGAGSERAAAGAAKRPNVLFILTDDMSADLIRYTTELQRLRQDGVTFQNFVYGNSLCCPSRASMLTGTFPHNNGVHTNNSRYRDGGFGAFLDDEDRTIGVRLQEAGYRTGLMGKYLNEYRPVGARDEWWYDYPADYVPPGWDEWHGVGPGGYNEMRYDITRSIDGKVKREYSDDFENPYLTDVLSDKAAAFMDRSVTEHPDKPFFLEVATFAPHPLVRGGFVPAPRDRADPETGFPGDCGPVDCRTVRAPRTPAFNADTSDKPDWVRREPLTDDEIAQIDQKFLLRVQMMQAVNDMIARLRAKLVGLGIADNTYLVFGSDNGFHLGQHRLYRDGGKSTAYEYDSVVPLTVVGPGVEAGRQRDELVQNVDLFATFSAMADEKPAPNDGHSFLGLLKGADGDSWLRDAAFIEFTNHAQPTAGDPDAGTQGLNRRPPSYLALRTATETYVEYETGEVEYYDLTVDPYQLRNSADTLPEARRKVLHETLLRLSRCGKPGEPDCWAASAIR